MLWPCALSYLIGTLPSGLLIGKAFGVDIRQQGSGNVGATNVARTVGKKAGIATLMFDIIKGIGAPLLVSSIGYPELTPHAAVCVVAGHCFSYPGLLRGGKGVATSLGAALYLAPSSAAGALLAFLCVYRGSKIVSLSSMLAVLVAPIMGFACGYSNRTIVALLLIAVIVCMRHYENIGRLLRGEEKPFSSRSST